MAQLLKMLQLNEINTMLSLCPPIQTDRSRQTEFALGH
jgi:hypothetical protein